jgi:hypothetical protein
MSLRRFTRLTNGFGRRLENHEAALGLFFCHYNFVARHSTLKTTPAVAAGLADAPWSVAELIERTRDYSPEPAPIVFVEPPPATLAEFIDRLPDED